MQAYNEKLVTRELLDCYRRDIRSGHPVFASRALKMLKECAEGQRDFDCEVTRLNALSLYGAVAAQNTAPMPSLA
jgi:hypothetical protein